MVDFEVCPDAAARGGEGVRGGSMGATTPPTPSPEHPEERARERGERGEPFSHAVTLLRRVGGFILRMPAAGHRPSPSAFHRSGALFFKSGTLPAETPPPK